MEGNRDEAEKCIKIATKALEAGDKQKALKFLIKAEKLFPTDRAKGEPGPSRVSWASGVADDPQRNRAASRLVVQLGAE